MIQPFNRTRSSLCALLACALTTACASPSPPKTVAQAAPETPAAAPATPASAPTVPRVAPGPEPPDGKWLIDEQGRRYFLEKVAKVEGWYHWLNPEKTAVRLAYGMAFEVASHDEDSIEIKIFKTEPPDPSTLQPQRRPEPTEEEGKAIAESYRGRTGADDRLTFEPYGRGLPARGQWRNGFKLADMNGDGHPDIVHGPPRKSFSPPIIFLGDGQGNWRYWAEARFPRLGYDYGDVAVADFNGDGRPDLALASHLRGLVALVADGPASFSEWSRGIQFEVPGDGGDATGFSSRALEAADWNGDGRPDLISLGEGPRMSSLPADSYGVLVYVNQGDGSWLRQDELGAGVRVYGDDLAVADFTHDGKLDVVISSSVMGMREILRIGGDGGSWSRADLPELRPKAYVGAVDAADFNGDGRLDLALGYLSREGNVWRTGVDLLLARREGGWERRPVEFEESRDWLTALDSGDLDGDGRVDLVAATGDGEVWVFLGEGNGSFLRETSPELATEGGCRGYDVQVANLDADPAEELVVALAGEPSALMAPTQCVHEGALMAWDVRAGK